MTVCLLSERIREVSEHPVSMTLPVVPVSRSQDPVASRLPPKAGVWASASPCSDLGLKAVGGRGYSLCTQCSTDLCSSSLCSWFSPLWTLPTPCTTKPSQGGPLLKAHSICWGWGRFHSGHKAALPFA